MGRCQSSGTTVCIPWGALPMGYTPGYHGGHSVVAPGMPVLEAVLANHHYLKNGHRADFQQDGVSIQQDAIAVPRVSNVQQERHQPARIRCCSEIATHANTAHCTTAQSSLVPGAGGMWPQANEFFCGERLPTAPTPLRFCCRTTGPSPELAASAVGERLPEGSRSPVCWI